jgi:hypothetical protein
MDSASNEYEMNQLTLFETKKDSWWQLHNYQPKRGKLTYMPLVCKNINSSYQTSYTYGLIGYIIKIGASCLVYQPGSKGCDWIKPGMFLVPYPELSPVLGTGSMKENGARITLVHTYSI